MVALGHDFGNYVISDETHEQSCKRTNCSEKLSALHTYGAESVTKQATCMAEGVISSECTVCGNGRRQSIARTPHVYGEWETIGYKHVSACTTASCTYNETIYHNKDGDGICSDKLVVNDYKFQLVRPTQNTRVRSRQADSDTTDAYAIVCGFVARIPAKELEIPESVAFLGQQIPVTQIAGYAFSGFKLLEKVTIPKSITKIGINPFKSCARLSTLIVDAQNTAYSVKGNCLVETETKLLKAGCYTSAIPADGSVIGIDADAFYGCLSLTSITIPDGIKSINTDAFYDCRALTSVSIPASVVEIVDNPFRKCPVLTALTVNAANTNYSGSGNCIVEISSKTLIAGCKGSIIANDGSVTKIGNGAFYGSEQLASLTLPDGLGVIGAYAFFECNDLVNFALPSSVSEIGEYAFARCSSLMQIAIPEGVEVINDRTFDICQNLASITLPESLTAIGRDVFMQCFMLEQITLPSKLQSIGQYAFAYTGLKSLNIPASVKFIGEGIIDSDMRAEALTVDPANTNYKSVDNCIIEIATKKLVMGCKNSVIPNDGGILVIGESALAGVYRTTTSITIPSGVSTIEDLAFREIENITSLTIPEGVTSIGRAAFDRAEKLQTLTLPNSLKSIGFGAFMLNKELMGVTIPNGVTDIESFAFEDCKNITSILIPASVINIGTNPFSGCEKLDSVKVDPNNKRYFSSGNCIIDKETKRLIVGSNKGVIPADGSVTKIAECAFRGYKGLKSIAIPNNVTVIEWSAFAETGLESVTIPKSITTLSSDAFYGCKSLKKLEAEVGNPLFHSQGNCIIATELKLLFIGCNGTIIPTDGSVTAIGIGAFAGSGATSISIPSNITAISERAFSYSDIVNIVIPDSVEYLGDQAFWYCGKLTSVTLSKSLTYIGKMIFDGCDALPSVVVPDKVTIIDNGAFSCDKLMTVTLPKSLTYIDTCAFAGRDGLFVVKYGGTKAQWNAIRKDDGWAHNWNSGIHAQDRTYEIRCSDGNIKNY